MKTQVYSGVCLCGHTAQRHHGHVGTQGRYAGECLAFGCNENAGSGPSGEEHCGRYVDRDDPDEAEKSKWTGTTYR